MASGRGPGSERLPAVLCIDVEPDERTVTLPAEPRWLGFEALSAQIHELRCLLAEATGRAAQFGWFLRMDPQVDKAYGDAGFAATRYEQEIAALIAGGDEVGLHTHSWRWDGGRWVSDHEDQAWVEHCVDTACDAFERSFGQRCRAHRHGDRFTSDRLLGHLVARGAEVDLTLEPGMPATDGLGEGEASTGTIPAVPAVRNRPHAIGVDGAGALLCVPLTSAPTLAGASDRGGPAHETLVLWAAPPVFAARLSARSEDPDLRHLAFAVRTDVVRLPYEWANVRANLSHLSTVFEQPVEWLTPSDARARLLRDPPSDVTWPGPDGGGPGLMAVLGRSLEQRLAALDRDGHDQGELVEVERAQSSAEIGRLRDALAAAEHDGRSLVAELDRLACRLEEQEATLTWRTHQRLLPLLRAVRRAVPWRR